VYLYLDRFRLWARSKFRRSNPDFSPQAGD